MDFNDLFTRFWWLIFPVGGMLMGLYAMISEFRHRSEKLNLLKTYVNQGKEPPKALLDALKTDEASHDSFSGSPRRSDRRHGVWYQVVTFAALAAGLGYYGYYGNHGNSTLFIAVALGFGIAAACLFVVGVIGALTRPKPRTYSQDQVDD